MAFEPQNKLERSPIRAAVDPAYRPQFYRDFVESDIFLIEYGPSPTRPERKVLEQGYPSPILRWMSFRLPAAGVSKTTSTIKPNLFIRGSLSGCSEVMEEARPPSGRLGYNKTIEYIQSC